MQKTYTSQEMLRATHGPGECFHNIAKLGQKPRWIITTWAALGLKVKS